MLPRLSGVIVPQRQNAALLRLVSLRWLGMVVALGVPRLTPAGSVAASPPATAFVAFVPRLCEQRAEVLPVLG